MNTPHICDSCRFCLNLDTPHPSIIVCDALPAGSTWKRRFIPGESCPFWEELRLPAQKHLSPEQ